MAIVKYGAIITDIRGSVGGHTFQQSKYGSSFRSKPFSGKGRSRYQQDIRCSLSTCQKAWHELSINAQRSWDAWADTYSRKCSKSNLKLSSGYHAFMRTNQIRVRDLDPILTDPSGQIFEENAMVPVIESSGVLFNLVANWARVPDFWNICEISFSSALPSFNRAYLSRVRYLTDATSSPLKFDLTSVYIARYGVVPKAGDILAFSILQWNYFSPMVYSKRSYIQQVVAI